MENQWDDIVKDIKTLKEASERHEQELKAFNEFKKAFQRHEVEFQELRNSIENERNLMRIKQGQNSEDQINEPEGVQGVNDEPLEAVSAAEECASPKQEELEEEEEIPYDIETDNLNFRLIRDLVQHRTLPKQFTLKETVDVNYAKEQDKMLLNLILNNKQYVETALKLTLEWTEEGENVQPKEAAMLLVLLRLQMRYLIGQYGAVTMEEVRDPIPRADPMFGLNEMISVRVIDTFKRLRFQRTLNFGKDSHITHVLGIIMVDKNSILLQEQTKTFC